MKKRRFPKADYILAALIALLIMIVGTFLLFKPSRPPTEIRVMIPGTEISMVYPIEGFYGHGAEIFEENTDRMSNLHIQPAEEYNAAIGMEFVTVDVRRFKDKTYPDLEAAIEQFPKGVYEEEYMNTNGRFTTINGRRVFVYEASEDVATNTAWMLDNDGALVIANIAYKGGSTLDLEAAAARNAELLLQIVKGLRF